MDGARPVRHRHGHRALVPALDRDHRARADLDAVTPRASVPRVLARTIKPPRMALDAEPGGVLLTVDGAEVPFDGGRKAMRRATWDKQATVRGRRYRMRHTGRWRAELERDGTAVATLARRRFAVEVQAAYREQADAVDATAAIALGLVFGPGAPGFLRNLLDAVTP